MRGEASNLNDHAVVPQERSKETHAVVPQEQSGEKITGSPSCERKSGSATALSSVHRPRQRALLQGYQPQPQQVLAEEPVMLKVCSDRQ